MTDPGAREAALLAEIRAIVAESGGRVRVARAIPDEVARERMAASFARGDLETWAFTEAYARAASDPDTILAGARSVLCVAVPYATPGDRSPLPRGHGRVSNYAWSFDYHKVVRQLLERIVALIVAHAGDGSARAVCDTAPLAERAFAAHSGLGWTGKHTLTIVPALGSYVFLGEVVTRVALATDAPLRKTCGTCTRCVRACPTAALRGDYTIDARRCISDLTQRTDAIPRELRPLIGDWIWGCDLCQEVCPPTRNAPRNLARQAFAPVDAVAARPDLVRLLELRSGEFRRRFRSLGLGWRGAAILRRNAAVALGNGLDRAAVAPLARALTGDPHAMVRGHVAWALGRIGSPQAIAALEHAREDERDESVQTEIGWAIEHALFRKV